MTNRAKYFVSSDIHGFYTEWMDALNEAGFEWGNPHYKIIVCGDLLDRGNEVVKCLDFVSKLIDQGRIICILGNHELLFKDIYKKKCFEPFDLHNGTKSTYEQLAGSEYTKTRDIIKQGYNNPLMQKYLNHLVNYYETDKYVFVHGYIPVIKNYNEFSFNLDDFEAKYDEDWRNANDVQWESATWVNPFKCWKDGVVEPNKTIVFGH